MKIRLIEVPMDFGANRRGVDMGPSALRLAGLKESLVDLGHEVQEERRWIDVPIQEHAEEFDPKTKFLPAIFQGCQALAQRVEQAMEGETFPLVMGGDHSIAIGTLAGLGAFYRKKQISWGVLWIDAHGDFNTPQSTPSGNVHGMSLAVSVGLGHPQLVNLHGDFPKVQAENVVLLGIRDLDGPEKINLRDKKIKIFTMADIDSQGIAPVIQQALDYLRPRVQALHISFDVDAVDPNFAPGVGTPVPGGLTYREVHLLMETLAQETMVKSAEVVEVNPILDQGNQTAKLAVEMMASLLGDTIL